MMPIEEIKKCFKCKIPKCSFGCPFNHDIPTIFKLYENEEYEKAYQLLLDKNPLIGLCGSLCPHEDQCAKDCTYYKAKNKRLKIELVEEDLLKRSQKGFSFPNINTRLKVAIIGAGPSGLACAIKLREYGLNVTIFDDGVVLGGVVNKLIPDFRFNKEYFDNLYNELKKDINFEFNKKLGDNLEINDLKEFDYIIIAVGSSIPIKILDNPKVLNGYEVLREFNLNKFSLKNLKIGVLGCGNTALDVARSLKRLDNDVSIIYRRNLENAPCTKSDILICKKEGIKFLELYSVTKYEENIATLNKMKLSKEVINGRQNFISTNEFINEEYDYLIECYSTKSDYSFLNNEDWFLYGKKIPNSILNMYFIGDYITGPSSIAKAIVSGVNCSKEIIKNIEEIKKIKEVIKDKKIVLGGSFNPPTIAHQELVNYLKKYISKNIVLLPNGNLYPTKTLLPFDDRIKLMNLAFKDVLIDTSENNQSFKGTYQYLKDNNHPVFIIGSDNLKELSIWKNALELISNNIFIVFKREYDNMLEIIENDELLSKYKEHFLLLNINISNVSSTLFRNTLNKYIVSNDVYEYIIKNKYYQS